MSSLPIRQKQLGLKESPPPASNPNKGFKGSTANPTSPSKESDWQGTTSGKHKHTYKNGD